jgi:hypothetical protein
MRKWRKRILKLLLLLLLIPLLAVAFLVFERVRGKISLARYKRALIDKGEKLTAQEMVLPSTNGENGAPEVFAAISELKEGIVLPKRYPPRMKVTPSGRAVVCFREDEWIEDKVTNDWNQVFDDLEANKAALNRIRAALEQPVLDNKVDRSLGSKMNFSHLAPAKSLTYWFSAGSQLALHENRPRDALAFLLSQIGLSRLLAEDRLAISELVRIAIAAWARNGTWEALQAADWNDEDLAQIQTAWDNQHFVSGLARGLEGEVVFQLRSYDQIRRSNEETVQMLYGMEAYLSPQGAERPSSKLTLGDLLGDPVADFLKKQLYCRIWRFAWLDQDERHGLEYMERLLNIARDAAKHKSYAVADPAVFRSLEDTNNKNFYNKLRFPTTESAISLSRTVARAMRAETERSLVICAVALKRYSLRHGAPPGSLDSLVPEFVSSVPVDYMDGKPLKYRLNGDKTFVLYSVGEDGKDDGGDTALMPDKTSLRDLWDRKDFVWPAPATPEEVEAYRKEAAKN